VPPAVSLSFAQKSNFDEEAIETAGLYPR